MNILLLPAAVMAAGALAAFLLRRKVPAATAAGCGTLCGSSAAGLIMLGCQGIAGTGFAMHNLFLLPVLLLALTAGIHSPGYLAGHGDEHSSSYWCFLNLTAAAMVWVTQSANALNFLLAWEIMGAASFALVIFDRHNRGALRAGWIYIMACHAGAAMLILLFFFPHTPNWMFLLGLIGFGLKIGLPLLHIWLPEAHPAAPAPVSALMSGAMIELGFFGLFTYGTLPDGNHLFYGWILTGAGLIAGAAGIIFALAQSNLKRLLAYSSIENMGILSCAAGMGFLGAACGNRVMMIAGFTGFGIHLLNHAMLKGGLFLAAGSVYKATGTLDMDETGGLLKRMPRTGTAFILHALALCGLPPFAGFAGEFLIYLAAFAGLQSGQTAIIWLSGAVLVILALTGGLAAAAMAKSAGAVFCGEPRSEKAANAEEVPLGMTMPVIVLFILNCLFLFLIPAAVTYASETCFAADARTVKFLSGLTAAVSMISLAATVITAAIFIIRCRIISRCGERISPTWDCGFARPDAKMEYTATSFSQNPVDFFRLLIRPVRRIVPPSGIFSGKAEFSESINDPATSGFWEKIFRFTGKVADRIHFLQSGNLHFYLLVVVITLAGMLIRVIMKGN
ncbi:MAG: hypothetical protein J6S43_04650 [Lentisphaeria bacterium]|nr:hypothetical protein [Lentisphaeria bacterium]